MSRTNLNFHQTFKPERQYLSALLNAVEECDGLDASEISALTGIPTGKSSGKVDPTICYLEYMGLINKERREGKYFLSYTPLGRCIKHEDSGLLEKLSLLAMHCMIVRPFNGAELWAHMFQIVFPKYHNQLTIKQFEKEVEIQFGAGTKMAPFNMCYQEIFAPLGLIDVKAETIKICDTKKEADFVFLYAMVLFVYWDEWLAGAPSDSTQMASQSEITAAHLKQIGFKYPFGWNEKEEYQILEMMAEKKLIVLNRQMVPYTIRRVVGMDDVIERLYSELC